ncbi:MAG TPA: hypothetical protein VHB25_21825 [Gemmatimonadaceae bacterium]|nr:hypothetical protein [Gemmatimonadaceae bacterium]
MRHIRAGLCLAALASLAACDVPTGLPQYDTEWNVPGKSTSISVNSFLPSGVTTTGDNSAFQVSVTPSTTSITRQLGQDCAACAVANGQTIPKPAFTGGGTSSVSVPSSLASATLVHDTLTVTINNGFNFDPIRPSAAAGSTRGALSIIVKSGGTIIGRDSLDGVTQSLAPGSSTVRKIPLTGGIDGASGITVSTILTSPAGDPVQMNSASSITVTGAVGSFYVSSAKVNLNGQNVTSSPTNIDLSGIGSQVTDHANGGSLLLTVTNPFSVSGTLNVTFSGGTQPIVKTVALAGGTTTPTVTFTKPELDALLGHDVQMTFAGNVNGSAVTVQPGQTISVSSRLQISINVGSNN